MKARKIQSRAASAPMFSLSSIGAAVAMALIATGGAHAAETLVGPTYNGTALGASALPSQSTNAAPITATITSATVGTTATGTPSSPNPGSQTTNGNLIGATATGNTYTNTIANHFGGDASLGIGVNTGAINSSVVTSKMAVESNVLQSGSLVNTDNTISATTTLNSGSSTVSGTAAAGPAAPLAGTAVLTYPAGAQLFDAKGNVVVTNVQAATGPDSSASVTGNIVDLALTTGGVVTVDSTLARNSVAAVFKGNTASNTASIAAGGAPTFAGSALVSNLQVNGNGILAATQIANNANTLVLGGVGGLPAGPSNQLQGKLSVQDNTISSAATGNEALGATAGTAGNRILIDGVSVVGSVTPASATNNSTHVGVGVTTNVRSDLAIVNSQGNLGVGFLVSGVAATTNRAQVVAAAQSINGGTLTLARNNITADAVGNTASSTIATGANGGSVAGTVALSNQQSNSGTPVGGLVLLSSIQAETGDATGRTVGSTVSVANNRLSATGQGNQITQSVALGAGGVGSAAIGGGNVTLTGGTSSDGRVSAGGAATLTNLQGNYGSPVGGVNVNPTVVLRANGGGVDIANNTLSVTGNQQEAVGIGSGATNSLSLSGNAVGTGAGIASVQMTDGTSPVGAGLSDARALLAANGNVSGGSLALTGNLQRSIAYGNAVANGLDIKTGNVAVAPVLLPIGAPASSVTANLASNLPFDNNAAAQPTVRAAYGVLNDQSVQATVNASTTGANTMAVNVGGNVAGVRISNDSNTVVSATYANDAANGIKLDVNNVTNTFPLTGTFVANVTNAQTVAGANTIISALVGGGAVERTQISGSVSGAGSSVSTSDNQTEALAFGSRATGNTVAVKGNNINSAGLVNLNGASLSAAGVLGVNAAFSVQNAQAGQGTVSATRSGGPEVLTQIGGNLANTSVDASRNSVGATATSNSAVNGVGIDANGITTSGAVQNFQVTSAAVTSSVGQESPFLNDKSGVQVGVGGASIAGAQISVDKNIASGSATGNAATNSIDVKGNTIATGSLLPAVATNTGAAASANGDYAISNVQRVTGPAPVSSKVAAAYGIDTAPNAVISGSKLSVSGNAQSAEAVANTGTNTIALSAGTVSARSALQSTQASGAAVEARSISQAFAPGAVGSSSVRLSDNSNSALAVINDVANKVTVAAGSASSLGLPALVTQGALPGNTLATGDQVIANRQSATTSVSSRADLSLYNEDATVPATSGLVNSTFTVSGNGNVSEATANRASNAMSTTGSVTQAARTAVLNVQDSGAAVTAQANTTATLTLTGANALNASTATLSKNTTGASAMGSAATNSLEVKGNSIAGSALPAVAQTGPGATLTALTADHVLGNVQVGTGAVSATVTGSIGVDSAPLSTVTGSTLTVSDNRQSAKAVANTALNSVSITGTNVAARSALQSTQSGLAPVAASSGLDVFAPAASSGSTVRLSGNSNSALGVINDVANTLTVAAGNVQPAGSTGAVSLIETGSADNVTANGDHVLSNRQTAGAAVSSTATTSLYNEDRLVPNTTGLVGGSFTVSGNSTIAEASANRATNTAAVTGDAAQGASAGIVNVQGSTGAVTATAVTTARVTLAGAVPLNGSSVSLDGNTTAALARGNAATNVLDSGAGSNYGAATPTGSAVLAGTPLALNVGASAAILNSQNNAGAVMASSSGVSYQVALNGTPGGAGTSNGTVGVTGNTLAAQAYGNSATNRVTQVALNTGTPSAAVGNYQVNTGAVTATVTSVNFGISTQGAVGNSALRTTGNQITASATGNSAVSSIATR
ncbi:beta strand repeat-containing protein [Variovorax sp. GB1P17]|uniref:beta strand repeat-containing protein n=1 Tax=Variovorax sp. GB1P17 TaxID=3443740 RepID=UPI003F45C0A5